MKFKKILAAVISVAMIISCVNFTTFAEETSTEVVAATAVAKVGNIEYATIDEAIAKWTNNTTLTLLSDVTLSDVIKLKSTEHHILDLGTHTMTAASGKNAIEIIAYGNGSAEKYAITINADATNPGGINAGSKSVVYYDYSKGTTSGDDRPIIKINGGVFTGATSSFLSGGIYFKGTEARKAATVNISGGTFNCSIYGTNKSKLIISGGIFNYSVASQGDSTANRLISGGTFKTFGFMTADSNNTKFWFGTSMGNSNVGVYVDDNGYIVVGGTPIAEAGDTFEASANYSGANSLLQYSSAKDNGLYYTSVEEAFADNNKASGSVTVYTDEIDMTNINYKGTIVVPEGNTLSITNAPAGLKVTDTTGKELDAVEVNGELIYGDVPVYAAYIGETGYETVQAAINAAVENDTVTISAGEFDPINISYKKITIQGTVGDDGELLTTIKGGDPAITGHSFNGTIKDIKIVDAWKVMYAEPAGNVTIDNVYVTGATYGFHLVAYSPDLTWTIQNSYMDLRWANSFGVYGDGYSDIIIKGNRFEATDPYYPDYGAIHVNSFLPSVTVEENIFGKNAKIYIDAKSVTDTSKINISKNYHADGVENAFADDVDGVTVTIYQYYTGVDEDGNLTGLVEIPVSSPVAKIGDVEYETLQDAFAAAVDGKIVKLIDDVELDTAITVAKDANVTLDLNGKNISMETANDTVTALILNNGNLTIADTSEAKTGKLSYNYTGADQADAHNTIETAPGSTLTVKGGTIENLSSNCLIAYAIDGLTNGGLGDVTVNIEGGKITSAKQSVRIFANSTTHTGTLNISGGEFSGRVIVQNSSAKANKAALSITGGTFNTNGYKEDVLYVGGSNGAYIDMAPTVTGGTFNGEISSSMATGFISGGTFTVAVDEAFCAEGFVPVDNGDGTYGVKEADLLDTRLAFIRNIETKNTDGEDRYQVILLFGIDSLMYAKAGFEITVAGKTRPEETRTVFTSYNAAGTTYLPSAWGETCNYICGLSINFPTSYASESVVVRPFVEHFDGSKTYGEYGTIDKIYNKEEN